MNGTVRYFYGNIRSQLKLSSEPLEQELQD
jgi:hypothetical protein